MAIVSRKVTKPDASTAGKAKTKLIKPRAVPQGRKLVGTMVTPEKEEIAKKTRTSKKKEPKKSAPKKKEPKMALARKGKMGFLGGIKKTFTGRSQGSGSNSGSESSLPPVRGAPPPAIAPVEPPPPVETILRILEQREHIIPRSEEERNRIDGLVDPQLLHVIGLLKDFESALRYTHLADFYDTAELGSRWLSIEFLASLDVDTEGGLAMAKFKFHIFNQDFRKSFKEMSKLLGFKSSTPWNIESLPNFSEQDFWVKIAGHDVPKRRTSKIHNPSLRILH
ncbi:hypothetical protein EJB05_49652, partial [Eragrostis curvula]